MKCPDAERLAAVASGDEDRDIRAHLDGCEACKRVFDALGPDDIADAPAGPVVGDPEPGDTVGRYVILARLGAGGMGVVSSAYDPTLDRMIALKSIRADRASPALARRLEREAQSLAKLTHPHLVRVFDAGVDRGRLYIAMELVDGTTLDRWLAQTPRGTDEIVRVFREIAEALATVHAQGFVHRDVKPDNILIDTKGLARLADFGLVSSAVTAEGGQPATGTVTDPFTAVGTPGYMSPEQRRGSDVDARSDQCSWAISLRHALGDRALDARLARVIDRAGHDDAAQRFPTMTAVAMALAPRPRRVWPVAAVAVGVLAIGVVVVARKAEPGDPCTAGDPFADWSARQPAIAKAFEASGHPSWAVRLESTTRAARIALTSLADTRVAVCKAAVAANRTDDQERACLDADRATVRALFDELAHANRAMVDQAPLAATLVPRGVQCRDVATHEVVRSDHALGTELQRVKAKSLVRAPKDVVDEAKALSVRATEAGAAQVEGEAKLLLGELQSRLRQDDAARITLDEAALAAARAHDDRVAALARLLQAGQAALITAAPERAQALGEVALAAVERAGSPAELRGQLENVLGGIAGSRGKFADAERHYRRAITARTEAFGADDHRVAAAHQNLGLTLHRLGRNEEARKESETALAMHERVLGTNHPELAHALNTLGTLAADDERHDDATKYLERALALRIETFGPDHPDVAISLNNLAKLANLRGAHRDAIAHYERSLAIVEAKLGKDALEVALPLSGLAAVHADLEEWKVARPYAERALAVAEAKRGKDHPALIAMLITYGNIRAHTGEPAAKRAMLERAYAIAKSKLGAEHAQTVSLEKRLAETPSANKP